MNTFATTNDMSGYSSCEATLNLSQDDFNKLLIELFKRITRKHIFSKLCAGLIHIILWTFFIKVNQIALVYYTFRAVYDVITYGRITNQTSSIMKHLCDFNATIVPMLMFFSFLNYTLNTYK